MEDSSSRTLDTGGLQQRKDLHRFALAGSSKPSDTASPSLLTENLWGEMPVICRHAPEKPFQIPGLPINATDKAVTSAFQKERRILHLNYPFGPEKILSAGNSASGLSAASLFIVLG